MYIILYMEENNIINIHNPIPILQQQKSNLFNNKNNIHPNISNIRKKSEQKAYSDIINQEHKKNIKLKGKTLNQNIADSFIGLIDDLFTKEKDTNWKTHLYIILKKDQRYYYLAILLLIIAFILIIFQKIKTK